jgi:3-oxoacyl-[acyl-carrier protein] reductase
MKHALVTGVSSGIGAAICKKLLAQGWQVTGFSRRLPDYQHANFTPISLDVTDTPALLTSLAGVAEVDAIIHAAGIMVAAPLGEIDYQVSDNLWRLHIQVPEIIVNQLVKRLPAGGRIVLIGSRTAAGVAQRSQYASTKSAMIGMVRSWAAELAARGITANIVAPAATETPMLASPERQQSLPKLPPIGRYIKVEEVAALVNFLLSDDAGAITGQQLLICGGASL